MANYCTNEIKILDLTPDDIKKILNRYCSRVNGVLIFDFEKIIPTPKELLDEQAPFRGSDEDKQRLIAKYGFADWYEFRVWRWGVKWPMSVDSCNVEVLDDSIEISGDTAWAPPINILKHFSTLFPNASVEAKFAEPGMMFAGYELFKNGEVLESSDDPDGGIMREIYGDLNDEDEEEE